MTSHDVDGGVESGEGRLARYIVEATIVGNEVCHLGLDRLGNVLVVGRVAVHEGSVPSGGKVRGCRGRRGEGGNGLRGERELKRRLLNV